MADGSIDIDLLINDLTDATLNKFVEKAKEADEKARKPFSSPIVQELNVDADTVGIKNYGRLLDELPKEKRTEMIAKTQKAEVTAMHEAINKVPKEKQSELRAMVESGKIKTFQELIHEVPKEHHTDMKAAYEDSKVKSYNKLLRALPASVLTKLDVSDGASPKLKKIREEAGKTEGKFASLKKISAGAFLGNLGAMAATKAIGAVTGAMDGAIKRVDTLANSQRTFENLNISAKDTKKGMEDLNKAIDGLPTALDDAVSGTTMLVSATKDMDKSVGIFKAVNDGVLGFGGSAENVNSMVTSLSKSLAAGKITGETLASMYDNKLGPVVGEVAKKMGMTQAQLTEAASKGEVDINKFQDALIDLDKNGSGSLKSLDQIAKDSTKGIGTSMQNMQSAITRSVGHVVEGMGPALIKNFDNIKDMLNGMKPIFKDVGEVFGAVFGTINDFTGMFATSLKANVYIPTEETGDKVLGLKDKILKFLEGVKPVAQAIAGFFGVVVGGAVSLVGTLVKAIVGGFSEANGKADEAKGAFDFSGIAASISKVSQFLNVWVKILVDIMKPLGEIVGIMAGGVFEMFADVIGGIAGLFKDTSEGAEEGADNINGVAKALEAIAKHKDALKIVAQTLAVMWVAGKAMAFAKALQAVALGIKATTLAMIENPIGLIITGIVLAIAALIVGLYQLYKHREEVGKFFSGVGKAIGEFFGGLGKWFSEAWDATKKFFDDITKPIREFFDGLGKWFSETVETISGFMSDIGDAIKEGFDKVVEFVSGYIDKVIVFWSKVAEAIGRGLILVLALFVGIGMIFYEAVIEPIVDVFIAFGKYIWDKVSEIGQGIADGFMAMAEWVMEAWESVWTPISEFLSDAWNGMKKIVDKGIKAIQKIIKSVGKTIDKAWKSVWNPISKFLAKIWNSMKKVVDNNIKAIRKAIEVVGKTIDKIWKGIWNPISKFLSTMWKKMQATVDLSVAWIRKAISSFGKTVDKIWQGIWNPISKFFSGIWDGIKKTASKAWNGLTEGIGKFGEGFKKAWSGIWDGVADTFKNIWNTIKGHAIDGWNGIIGIINKGIGGINSVIHKFGGSEQAIKPVDKVKKYAQGTSGAARGLAMVNDGNGPELIIDNQGSAHILEGRDRLVQFSGGETVVPHEATKAMFGGVIPKFKNGTPDWLEKLEEMSNYGLIGDIKDGASGAFNWVVDKGKDGINWVGDKISALKDIIKQPFEFANKVMTDMITKNLGSPAEFGKMFTAPMGRGLVTGITKPIKAVFEKLLKKQEEVESKASGKGVMSRSSFNETAHKAASIIGEKLSDNDLNYLWKQAMTESNVNPDINHGYDDGDGTGQPRGLFQYKLSTFKSDMYPGHGNILSALDQLLAVMNRTGWRSAMPSQFPSGKWPSGGSGWGPVGAKRFSHGGWGGNGFGIFNEVPGQEELVVNPHQDTSDYHIEQAIAKRSMLAPESSTARLAQVVNAAKSGRDTLLNSQITNGQVRTNTTTTSDIDLSGNVELVVQIDSDTVAKATYPKIKLLQDADIQLSAQANGYGGMSFG